MSYAADFNLTHLYALRERLYHEQARLDRETHPSKIAARKVWVAQCEKEIADELAFLKKLGYVPCELSDEDLLAELTA